MNVRTRFAPSPTGMLHVGSARTALFAWLFARAHGGSFILRIEDTDKEREVAGAIEHIQESLTWLGITWDEGVGVGGAYGPYIQSERLDVYRTFAQKLIAAGHAYTDPYSEAEVEVFRQKAEAEKRPFLYRNHRPGVTIPWDGHAPLRFKVPTIKRMAWNDLVFGDLTAGEEALDDFVLIKADGYPTYNFAHVVDDITMEISHVMRGQEFIASTPKFLSLYEALGEVPPLFATLPPILGAGGTKKLSKRDGAQDVLDYRTQGYLPEALSNFLALLGWHPSTDQEYFTPEELCAAFDVTRVQKSGAQFDVTKLNHLNQQHLRSLSDADYALQGEFGDYDPRQLSYIVPLLKERAHTFGEARELLRTELAFITHTPTLTKELLLSKEVPHAPGSTSTHLHKAHDIISELAPWGTSEEAKVALMAHADTITKEDGGRGALLWPLRYALSGRETSPDPFTIIAILGRDESLARIAAAFGILGE